MLAAILSSKGNIVLFVKVEQVYHKMMACHCEGVRPKQSTDNWIILVDEIPSFNGTPRGFARNDIIILSCRV